MILEDLGGRILEDLGGSWRILNRRKFTQTSPRVNMCVFTCACGRRNYKRNLYRVRGSIISLEDITCIFHGA